MPVKKQIIAAFENLDANLLDVVLDDNGFYQNIDKQTFVAGFRKYFDKILEKEKLPFKSFEAKHLYNLSDDFGYSFVNEHGVCYLTIEIKERNNKIVDIRQYWQMEPQEKIVKSNYDMHIFYLNDKADYIETQELIIKLNILKKSCSGN